MFWTFLLVVAIGIVFFNLGAVSVLAGLLLVAFKAAFVVIVLLAGLLAWSWYKNRRC